MIRIHISAQDLAEFRFAFSPMEETLASIRVLMDPSRNAFHLPWISKHREELKRLDLAPLLALTIPLQTDGYVPDFLTPAPEGPYPDFEEELARVRGVDHAQMRRELDVTFERRPMPEEARHLYDHPDDGLDRLVGALRTYWTSAVEPDWPRIRALLEGDVMYRAREIALHGPEVFFEEMPPGVRYADGVLEIERTFDHEMHLDGRGLLLLPIAFATPRVFVMLDEPYQPTLCYPPRGVATLWGSGSEWTPKALEALLGGRRAAILRSLEVPLTTTDLADRVGVTPAAVSQQLTQLRDSGLVESRRNGSRVYSSLTLRGNELLLLFAD